MSRNTLYLSLLSLAVMGCSTVYPKRADGDFEYLKHKEGKELQIPAELDKPNYSDEFKISKEIDTTGPLGDALDIRSPALVLPIAASSRIVLADPTTKIWFDKVFEDRDLQEFIQYSLNENLKNEDVTLTKIDDNTYTSSWFLKENITDNFIYETLDSTESMRFKYIYEVKPHRRSLSLRVDLVDYMKTDDAGGTKTIAPIDKKRAEVNMLNQIVTQVDYEYRLQQQKNRLAKVNQDLVIVGMNQEGEPAYIVEMDFDILWDSMPIFFSDYGFKITDLNEQKYIYYVDFTTPEVNFWDIIWGDKVEAVDVKNDKYEFKISSLDKERSAVTIYNSDGEVLPSSTLERIFPVMGKGLSFRTLF